MGDVFCRACRRDVPGPAAYCPTCGAILADAGIDDENAATRAFSASTAAGLPDETYEEIPLIPPRRARWPYIAGAGASLVVVGAVAALAISPNSQSPEARVTEPVAAAAVEEPDAQPPAPELITPESGIRPWIEAAAPLGISIDDLGRPFDERFRPIEGPDGHSVFPESEPPRQTTVNAFDHRLVEIGNQEGARANFSVWVVSASLGYDRARRYVVYRAVQVEKVVKLDDSGRLRPWPKEAVYYLSEIHLGHMYEAIIHGTERTLHAGVKADLLVGSGEISGYLSKYDLEANYRGLGMQPDSGKAIFARSPDEIGASYSTTGPAVPVLVRYRRIPGVDAENPRIRWGKPTVFERVVLQDDARKRWFLNPGRYQVLVESEPDDAFLFWEGVDCPRVDGKRLDVTCDAPAGANVLVRNPCLACIGGAIDAQVTIWRLRD